MNYQRVTPIEIHDDPALADWRVLLQTLTAEFAAPSFSAAAELVNAIAVLADDIAHHPDIDVRYPNRVVVTLTTHAVGGLTTLDVTTAERISELARARGAVAQPATNVALEWAIDTVDADRIRPFWAAVLGARDVDGVLVDPLRRAPAVWFQVDHASRPGRGRMHVDVTVAGEIAEARVAAALAAGGTLVSADNAPRWWVLADADGNEVCVSTWRGRDAPPG